MHISQPSPIAAPLTTWPALAHRNPASLAADLLPLCDFVILMGLTSLASGLFGRWLHAVGTGPDLARVIVRIEQPPQPHGADASEPTEDSAAHADAEADEPDSADEEELEEIALSA